MEEKNKPNIIWRRFIPITDNVGQLEEFMALLEHIGKADIELVLRTVKLNPAYRDIDRQ